ncbi:AaceriADR088Cp [[Ashbya] aceris (nom. inval.)]|nr:AaceriADR088Cp [[Ashbya] aceris (nom. inval.)]
MIKKRRTGRLRRLTGALRELLDEQAAPADTAGSGEPARAKVVYVMSRENEPIPRLSDAEVMERHRRADENMKQAWTRIIEKYSALDDQGDVVDLHTGEIVEDNGHIRGLSAGARAEVRYESALRDLVDVDEDRGGVWSAEETEGAESGAESGGAESEGAAESDLEREDSDGGGASRAASPPERSPRSDRSLRHETTTPVD